MEDIKTQLANRLKEASNVLVTVTKNPTIDQLSAAIGLTLILNRLGKHATTVFSGAIPPVIEFLHPEKTIEKNTDSLRDFIISLDKAKADKLRYKIEDQFVKIYITPYHTSINDSDLVFSQGDFNVDVVVGVGVHQREELDQVITAHGRILHDATVSTINTVQPSTLGSINWADKTSSSLCEMLVYLCDLLAKDGLLDAQIANALLTGIVSETQRFSNPKTTAITMSASSRLLAAGANQQLIAAQLTPPEPKKEPETHAVAAPPVAPKVEAPVEKPDEKGTIHIDHPEDKNKIIPLPADDAEDDGKDKLAQVQIDDQGTLKTIQPVKPIAETDASDEESTEVKNVPEVKKIDDTTSDEGVPGAIKAEAPPTAQTSGYMKEPPSEMDDNLVDPLAPADGGGGTLGQGMPPLLSHDDAGAPEKPDLDSVRDKINAAIASKPDQDFMAPITSLNSQPMGDNLHPESNLDTQIDAEDLPAMPPPPIPPPIIPPGGVPDGNPSSDAL